MAERGGRPGSPVGPQRLWRNRDFARLWSSEALSQFGFQITVVALPLTAVITLEASPEEVGLLSAAQYAPVVAVSLFAGIWLDNHRRRPVLIAAYLGRALSLAVIPLLYALDMLSLGPLYAIALAAGLCSAVSDVAYITYLPQLVSRGQLVQANARLEATYSMAEIAGPSLGGVLVQALTAPIALLSSSFTNLVAAVMSMRITHAEAPPRPVSERPPSRAAIAEGLRSTLGHPIFRPLVLQAAAFNLFVSAVLALFLLYGVRQLDLQSSTLGFILGAGSVGGLAGTFLAHRAAERLGVGSTLVWSMGLASVALVLVPLAGGSTAVVVATLITGLWLHGMGQALFNVHSLSLRAMLSPSDTLGRVTATFRFISNGTLPLGGLLGGYLGEALGVRTAIAISVAGLVGSAVVFAFTRVRGFVVADVAAGEDGS